MKKYILPIALIASPLSAGGISGGGGVPALEGIDTLALMSLSIDQLPKAYATPDDFRRASARLSVTGTETASMTIEGGSIQVRKLRDSIVDDKVLKQILPAERISQLDSRIKKISLGE